MTMLGLDPRAARIAWTVAVVAILLYVVFVIRKTLFVFALALFLGYMIGPLVNLLDRYRPRRLPQGASVVAAFTLVIGIVVTGIALLGPVISTEAANLMEQLPKLAQRADAANPLPLPRALESIRAPLEAVLRQSLAGATGSAIPFVRRVGETIVRLAGNLPLLVLIPILAFFFVKDGTDIRSALLQRIKTASTRNVVSEALVDIDAALGQYVRALGVLALATLVAYAAFFTATGVPYAFLLAAIAAVLEFIPLLGPLAAAVIALVVAGVAGYDHLIWIAAFIAVYRGFQDYVLSPKLMSGGADVHPALIIFGFLAGEELAGIPGMFLSVPVIAILVILGKVMLREKRTNTQGPPRTG